MKKVLIILLCFSFSFTQAQNNPTTTSPSFNPTIKFKGLVHARYEQSITDSIDVQGKFNTDPVRSNFRLRRLEMRSDIKLDDHWSGVIRIQLPELKSVATSFGKVIELAYFEYKCKDQLSVRGGQFKVPMELDELISHEDLRMIDRGSTSRMFVNNNWASYQPGLMVFGTFFKEKKALNYYAGIFNGGDRSVNYDNNSGKNYAGRLEFYPIKSLRIGANAQLASIMKSVTGDAEGGDISFQPKLSDNLNLIIEGEYLTGTNILSFIGSSDSVKDVNDFRMTGFFGQALLRIGINKPCLRTFEIGGRYEVADPLDTDANDDYNTITGGIGFIFLPDNDARLQLNMVHTDYKVEDPGARKNNNMLVVQLQLKI